MVHVVNCWDELCNWCILLLENLCHLTGLTYGFINVLFFCILGPLSTLCFMGSTATAMFGKSDLVKRRLTYVFAVVGLLCILAILFPCLWAAITL
ncbi:MAG: hypothetical protein K2I18_02370 [Paramuribaculum sp.]|nr:hypothetical protein [Paramuribaculum sp.]